VAAAVQWHNPTGGGINIGKLVVAGAFLVLAGFVLCGQTAAQQPFVVQYVDGSVQVQLKRQTAWKTLKPRDQVLADAIVRLAEGAMVEIVRDKSVPSLIKDGTYQLASLADKVLSSSTGLLTLTLHIPEGHEACFSGSR
jgi:hypothetical protein